MHSLSYIDKSFGVIRMVRKIGLVVERASRYDYAKRFVSYLIRAAHSEHIEVVWTQMDSLCLDNSSVHTIWREVEISKEGRSSFLDAPSLFQDPNFVFVDFDSRNTISSEYHALVDTWIERKSVFMSFPPMLLHYSHRYMLPYKIDVKHCGSHISKDASYLLSIVERSATKWRASSLKDSESQLELILEKEYINNEAALHTVTHKGSIFGLISECSEEPENARVVDIYIGLGGVFAVIGPNDTDPLLASPNEVDLSGGRLSSLELKMVESVGEFVKTHRIPAVKITLIDEKLMEVCASEISGLETLLENNVEVIVDKVLLPWLRG